MRFNLHKDFRAQSLDAKARFRYVRAMRHRRSWISWRPRAFGPFQIAHACRFWVGRYAKVRPHGIGR